MELYKCVPIFNMLRHAHSMHSGPLIVELDKHAALIAHVGISVCTRKWIKPRASLFTV